MFSITQTFEKCIFLPNCDWIKSCLENVGEIETNIFQAASWQKKKKNKIKLFFQLKKTARTLS